MLLYVIIYLLYTYPNFVPHFRRFLAEDRPFIKKLILKTILERRFKTNLQGFLLGKD